MSPTVPVSSPFGSKGSSHIRCYVEIEGKLREASWPRKRGNRQAYPDFNKAHPDPGITIRELPLSNEIAELYKTSRLLGFGSDGCIRLDDDAIYPAIKIAHPTVENRRRIKYEFGLMCKLSHLDFVVNMSGQPLVDEDGIFGFRLERLDAIDFEALSVRRKEVEAMFGKLHQAGFCHGDFSFSNSMQRNDGSLVLIDFGFAGPLGGEVPEDIPQYLYPDGRFTIDFDRQRMDKCFGQFSQRLKNDVGGRV